jgi:hypothetical protein
MEIDAPIRRETWLDHYASAIPFSHLMVVTIVIFLCVVIAVFKNPRVYFRLMTPASALPIMIGILGTAYGLKMWLSYYGFDLNGDPAPWNVNVSYALTPLVMGSSLSGLFILITLFVLFVVRHSISDSPSK